jgi:hypothetical protein
VLFLAFLRKNMSKEYYIGANAVVILSDVFTAVTVKNGVFWDDKNR